MLRSNHTIGCENGTQTTNSYLQHCGGDVIENKSGVWILIYIPPILIIIGSLGNVLSIIVLCRKNMRRSNISIYLIILAVTDIIVLNVGLTRNWIQGMNDVDIRDLAEVVCKFQKFLLYFTTDFSAWMLVFITCERTLTIWFPHSSKCSRKLGLITILVMGIFLAGINCHFFYGMSRYSNVLGKCDSVDDDYHHFYDKVWPWIDLVIFSVGPVTVLAIGNSLIIFKVFDSRKTVQKATRRASTTVSGSNKTSSMTIMLIFMNIVFVVCTLPICVFELVVPYIDITEAQFAVAEAYTLMLQYFNFSINFFLYCFGGSRFRKELVSIFVRHKRVHPLTTETGHNKAADVPSGS